MSSPALPLPALGTRIGNYRLVRLLGRGGMGAVFEAFNESVGGRAAIKILHVAADSPPDVTKRFFDEARAANAIEHPSIIRIFDSGRTPEGLAYLAMEFLNGETLGQRIKRLGRLPVSEAIRLTRQVAAALSAVHERGVIHRDLKPDNLMILADPEAPGGERIKVLDFGIARLAVDQRSPGSETASRVLMGTPTYMSPEQCHGAKQVSAQSDVYSLGVILYKMLAGQEPFVSPGLGALLSMHLTEQPAPIREHNPEVPFELARLLNSMLEKLPAARPTMRAVDGSLRGLLSVAEAQPEAPSARHEAVTRKLAPVDLQAMLPHAKPSARRPAGQAPAKQAAAPRLSPAPLPSPPRAETTTLSRSSPRRLLLLGLSVVLSGGAVGGIGITLWHIRGSQAQRPAASRPAVSLRAEPGQDLGPPTAAVPDLSSVEDESDSATDLAPPPPAEPKNRAGIRTPVLPISVATEPARSAAVKITPAPFPEKPPSGATGPAPELPLKLQFPGSPPTKPADGGAKQEPPSGLRDPFKR